jgi:hypothetical protein
MQDRLALSLTAAGVVLKAPRADAVRVAAGAGQWRAAIDAAIAKWREKVPGRKAEIHAGLGFDSARVALMTVDGPRGLLSLPKTAHLTLVRSWVADMLHVDPDSNVLRWQAMSDPRQVLVSCVDAQALQDIESACADTGIRVSSCRPAVLDVLDSIRELRGAGTDDVSVACTEEAAADTRHATAQFFRFKAKRLHACWRGWVPCAEEEDGELARAHDRFDESTGGTGARRASRHWPASA